VAGQYTDVRQKQDGSRRTPTRVELHGLRHQSPGTRAADGIPNPTVDPVLAKHTPARRATEKPVAHTSPTLRHQQFQNIIKTNLNQNNSLLSARAEHAQRSPPHQALKPTKQSSHEVCDEFERSEAAKKGHEDGNRGGQRSTAAASTQALPK